MSEQNDVLFGMRTTVEDLGVDEDGLTRTRVSTECYGRLVDSMWKAHEALENASRMQMAATERKLERLFK